MLDMEILLLGLGLRLSINFAFLAPFWSNPGHVTNSWPPKMSCTNSVHASCYNEQPRVYSVCIYLKSTTPFLWDPANIKKRPNMAIFKSTSPPKVYLLCTNSSKISHNNSYWQNKLVGIVKLQKSSLVKNKLFLINPFAPTAPETARKKQWCFKKSNLCETSS